MAGDNAQVGIALHIAPNVANPCDPLLTSGFTAGTIVDRIDPVDACTDFNAAYTVWVLVCNGSDSTGVAGIEFGLNYTQDPSGGGPGGGLFVDQWLLCADQDFNEPGFPSDPNTGSTVTWDPINNCQNTNSEPFVPRTVIAVAGAMRVFAYSPDIMSVIPKPATGRATVADCSAAEQSLLGNSPSHLGQAGFCSPGYNPCGLVTPVQDKTWGSIKHQFDSN